MTAAQPPIQTSAFSWGDFATQLLQGATTVAAAKYLANAPSGQQIAGAAATPTTPTGSQYTGPALTSSPISPLVLAGGAVLVGLALVLVLRK